MQVRPKGALLCHIRRWLIYTNKIFFQTLKFYFRVKPLINKHIVRDNVALRNLRILTKRFIV